MSDEENKVYAPRDLRDFNNELRAEVIARAATIASQDLSPEKRREAYLSLARSQEARDLVALDVILWGCTGIAEEAK